MSKFSTCVYGEYFAEYSMRICNHPVVKSGGNGSDAPCKGCKFHETAKSGLEKCPFCGGSPYCHEIYHAWEVKCQKCGANIKGESVTDAKNAWNRRF